MPAVELVSPTSDMTIFGLFMQASFIVKLVMLALILSSIWCWAVIFDKSIRYRKMRRAIQLFETMFWSGQSLEDLYHKLNEYPLAGMGNVFMAAMREWKKSFEKGVRSPISLQMRIDRAMNVALAREQERMEVRLGSLATIGSAAPFVGLFGTVIGIMVSFQSIAASKNTSLAVVAPGIAEALLATAMGLLAAIPAVIAYNKLKGDSNQMNAQLENFADELSGILSRQIDERLVARPAKS